MDTLLWQLLILSGGTLFAWYNVAKEFKAPRGKKSCSIKGCTTCSSHPLTSACFFGALFFSAALILNIIFLFF